MLGLVVTVVVVVVVPSLPSATDSPTWQHTNCIASVVVVAVCIFCFLFVFVMVCCWFGIVC